MKTVKINVENLLKTVKENRTKHIEEYNEALKGYREKCIALLAAELKKAESGENFETFVKADKPHSYESEYNRVISMLEWTEEEIVELDATEFDQYVNDNWHWQGGFKAVTSFYNNSK